MMPLARRCLAVASLGLSLWLTSTQVIGQTLYGQVVRVLDGDTLEILTPEHDRIRVRLAWIDAPEKGQPFGSRAREHLAAVCAGLEAEVQTSAIDRYGRTVAEVRCMGIEANQAMLSGGLAWVYRQYAPEQKEQNQHLYNLERKARAAKLGLWSEPHPTAPWAWRKAQRTSR